MSEMTFKKSYKLYKLASLYRINSEHKLIDNFSKKHECLIVDNIRPNENTLNCEEGKKLGETRNFKGRTSKRIPHIILAAFVLVFVLILGINQLAKLLGEAKLEKALKGQCFENVYYYHDLKLKDNENDKTYRYHGAKSNFKFNDDKTLTWERQYNTAVSGSVYTEPVTTNEKYEAKYLGGFLYDSSAFYIKLESGDILDVEYDSLEHIEEVNYSILHDDKLNAPEQLKNVKIIKPKEITSSSKKSNSFKNKERCPTCSGTGKITAIYGNTWRKNNPGYEVGDPCVRCGGKGYIQN